MEMNRFDGYVVNLRFGFSQRRENSQGALADLGGEPDLAISGWIAPSRAGAEPSATSTLTAVPAIPCWLTRSTRRS